MSPPVRVSRQGRATVVLIDRPERRNAVDLATAEALIAAFLDFDRDPDSDVAVLAGAQGTFCAGADLTALAKGEQKAIRTEGSFAPMGPTRLRLSKPVIGAIEGHAVAGGLELALWCDLRVAAASAKFGIYNRRFGVPLIDLGTMRLPRIIGHGRAMDLILTGRTVEASEALAIGLVSRVCNDGEALAEALQIAVTLSGLPQRSLRNDRLAAIEAWDLDEMSAIRNEVQRGRQTLASGETADGAQRFAGGEGRHGAFS